MEERLWSLNWVNLTPFPVQVDSESRAQPGLILPLPHPVVGGGVDDHPHACSTCRFGLHTIAVRGAGPPGCANDLPKHRGAASAVVGLGSWAAV
jgi:hypothetical protein